MQTRSHSLHMEPGQIIQVANICTSEHGRTPGLRTSVTGTFRTGRVKGFLERVEGGLESYKKHVTGWGAVLIDQVCIWASMVTICLWNISFQLLLD